MVQSPPRLSTILSFSNSDADADAYQTTVVEEHLRDEVYDDAASDDSDDSFQFTFARPLAHAAGGSASGIAVADDLFAHGRILPAYPVFDRRILLEDSTSASASDSFTAPPSPDTYCAWAPRSAPGSPTRDFFPKSASTGEATAARRFRLRDLLVGSGVTSRSHSDGKEKFLFLQPTTPQRSALSASAAAGKKRAKKPAPPPPAPAQQQRQGGGKKKGAVTEMDMATAHKLFYSKPGATGERRQQQQASYLPYRPGIVGFFAAAHALGRRSHHHPC